MGAGAWFEPGVVTVDTATAGATAELLPAGGLLELGPQGTPLRTPWVVAARLQAGRTMRRIGLYRSRGKDWDWVRATIDTVGRSWRAETRSLGRFALLEDVRAPRVRLLRARRRTARGAAPYSRWALEARVQERGSGVDPSRSLFVVDATPVPSEWDVDAQVLRWRPRTPPARGAHRFTVTVYDRAGNRAQAGGRFVID